MISGLVETQTFFRAVLVVTLITSKQSSVRLAPLQMIIHQITLGCSEVAVRTSILRVSLVSLDFVLLQAAFKTAFVVTKVAFEHFIWLRVLQVISHYSAKLRVEATVLTTGVTLSIFLLTLNCVNLDFVFDKTAFKTALVVTKVAGKNFLDFI